MCKKDSKSFSEESSWEHAKIKLKFWRDSKSKKRCNKVSWRRVKICRGTIKSVKSVNKSFWGGEELLGWEHAKIKFQSFGETVKVSLGKVKVIWYSNKSIIPLYWSHLAVEGEFKAHLKILFNWIWESSFVRVYFVHIPNITIWNALEIYSELN